MADVPVVKISVLVVSRVQPLLIKCGGGGEASGDSGHTFVALPEFG